MTPSERAFEYWANKLKRSKAFYELTPIEDRERQKYIWDKCTEYHERKSKPKKRKRK